MIGVGIDPGLVTHWKIASGVGEPTRARYMDVIHDTDKLTTHWIVSDCDLEKVSVCTPSRDCVGLHMHVVGCVCAWNLGAKFF